MNDERRDDVPDAPHDDERESAYELFQRGQVLLDRHHHAQAAVVLGRADRLEPGKASILEALGRAYFNSGQHEAARATFERLLEIDPSAHYAQYALGQSLKKLGRREEAGTHLRLAVALDPTSALYRGALGRLGAASRPPRPRPAAEPSPPRDRPDLSGQDGSTPGADRPAPD